VKLWGRDLEPKLFTMLREGFPRGQIPRDLLAGVVVGIVALPLAIAFGIASGVRPEQGLATAIVAGLVISLFSGSRVQIGGPTGAFIVVIAGIVAKHGVDGLALATLMAGVLLIVMAFARFGAVIRFIPYPVTVGFTSGIALIIASAQLRDALGLKMESVPADFLPKVAAIARHVGGTTPAAAALAVGTMVVIALWPRVTSRVPGTLVALLAATVAAKAFHLDVETIGSRFGSVPSSLPPLRFPSIDWAKLPTLVSPAVSIALLCGIESLLCALVADGMTGRRHRSNAELLAQGLANLVSPLFGGLPATGAIARTATNVRNGGRTPIAGIVHAATLYCILLFAGRYAALIPMATLAGILLMVAWNMSEWHTFARLLRGPRSDAVVLVTTFVLTVVVDLTFAIQAGVALAALLLMRRMAEVTKIRSLADALRDEENGDDDEAPRVAAAPGVEAFSIQGSFCFGAAQKFSEAIGKATTRPRAVVIDLEHVLAIDATGMYVLEEVVASFRRDGARVLLSGLHAQPLTALQKSGFLDHLGLDHVLPTFDEAITRANELATAGSAPAPAPT
jgi:SulP family sulfate permease